MFRLFISTNITMVNQSNLQPLMMSSQMNSEEFSELALVIVMKVLQFVRKKKSRNIQR